MKKLILILLLLATPVTAQVAVKGGVVHTMDGAAIIDGVVVVTDGLIAALGPAADVTIPDGYRVLEAAVVTPGLVDAHATVGLINRAAHNSGTASALPKPPINHALLDPCVDIRRHFIGKKPCDHVGKHPVFVRRPV